MMGLDGRNRVNLTNHPANDFSPEWSPDGSKIIFRTDRDGNHEIYVMNADGSNPVNLTKHPAEERSPAWSPDGRRIAFSSDRHGDRDIYVMNADGSNAVRLAVPGEDEYPTWSPDGTEIAFTSFCATCTGAALHVMRSDGTDRRLISDDAGWPDWSPDGRLVAFDARGSDGQVYVFTLRPHVGSEPRRIVRGVQGDWSPDNSEIVYVVHEGELTPERNSLRGDIYVANTDGSKVRRITRTPNVFEFEPTWRP